MESTMRGVIWDQFGAAIDMLDNALADCPDELWTGRLYEERELQPQFGEFWYIASHVLFWLDYYLSETVEGFAPPPPFTLVELDPAGVIPERVYTKFELRAYLDHGRRKCRARLAGMTDAELLEIRPDWRGVMTQGGALLYNMRHVQEHNAQLSLFLGAQIGWQSKWVSHAQ